MFWAEGGTTDLTVGLRDFDVPEKLPQNRSIEHIVPGWPGVSLGPTFLLEPTALILFRHWVLFFRKTRKFDGKRVESKVAIGLVENFPDKRHAWAKVERLHLTINQVNSRRGITFGDIAQHYAEHELVDHTESLHAKAYTTVRSYERIIRNRLLPKWGNRIAVGIEPLEVEHWLKDLKRERKFANPTLDKTRRVMSLMYKHGQRYGLIPRNQESNPMRFVRCRTTRGYEAMIRTERLFKPLLDCICNPKSLPNRC